MNGRRPLVLTTLDPRARAEELRAFAAWRALGLAVRSANDAEGAAALGAGVFPGESIVLGADEVADGRPRLVSLLARLSCGGPVLLVEPGVLPQLTDPGALEFVAAAAPAVGLFCTRYIREPSPAGIDALLIGAEALGRLATAFAALPSLRHVTFAGQNLVLAAFVRSAAIGGRVMPAPFLLREGFLPTRDDLGPHLAALAIAGVRAPTGEEAARLILDAIAADCAAAAPLATLLSRASARPVRRAASATGLRLAAALAARSPTVRWNVPFDALAQLADRVVAGEAGRERIDALLCGRSGAENLASERDAAALFEALCRAARAAAPAAAAATPPDSLAAEPAEAPGGAEGGSARAAAGRGGAGRPAGAEAGGRGGAEAGGRGGAGGPAGAEAGGRGGAEAGGRGGAEAGGRGGAEAGGRGGAGGWSAAAEAGGRGGAGGWSPAAEAGGQGGAGGWSAVAEAEGRGGAGGGSAAAEAGGRGGAVGGRRRRSVPPGRAGAPRVALLSSAGGGGAGLAARRLAEALGEAGIACDLVDAPPLPADVAPPGSFAPKPGDAHVSVERPGFLRADVVDRLARCDVVNVHWAAGLIAVGELFALAQRGVRVVLTLHDFGHVTGGCHYPGACTGWTGTCPACPQLDSLRAEPSVPRRMRRARADVLAHPNVEFTAPSAWLVDAVVAAGVVPAARAHLLRNPLRPTAPARTAAERTGVPKKILLAAAHLGERRKNLFRAVEALEVWRRAGGEGVVHLVGAGDSLAREGLSAAGVPFVAHGFLPQEAMSKVLRDADVVLTASLEDNWPNVLVEAGVFGAAAVVGPGHGGEEFVRRFGHGRVAADFSAEAFAAALGEALALAPEEAVRAAGLVRAEHAPAAVAGRFAGLFLAG